MPKELWESRVERVPEDGGRAEGQEGVRQDGEEVQVGAGVGDEVFGVGVGCRVDGETEEFGPERGVVVVPD